MNILVSDKLSTRGVEVLERAGFTVTVNTKLSKEELLEEIKKYEDSHLKQWRKLVLNVAMILSLILISLLKGKGDGSMTGIIKCSGIDWGLLSILIISGIALTIVGILLIRSEY